MNRTIHYGLAATAAAVLLLAGPAAAESGLSTAEQAVIAKKTARVSATEKQMIESWSDGKKLAEFFCAGAGLAKIRKAHPKADRLVLGPSENAVKAFKVDGNRGVAGAAALRVGGDWKELSFECKVDPERAVVVGFEYAVR